MNMLLTARQLDRLRELPPDHKVLTARDGSPILQRPDGGLWRVQPNGSLAQASAARDVCCPRPAVGNAGTVQRHVRPHEPSPGGPQYRRQRSSQIARVGPLA